MSKLVEEAGGFAEVFPEHKFEVVEVLQKGKHIVGMTGVCVVCMWCVYGGRCVYLSVYMRKVGGVCTRTWRGKRRE